MVGAGIAGLAAAHDLAVDHDVLVLEGSPEIGGKLRLATVAGVAVDVGAEAMLNRRPEGVALARDLGLDVVHPTSATSRIFSRGALRPMPRSLMGVPFDLDELAASEVLSADGLARARSEVMTPVGGDVSVGDLVAARLGDEVVDRLVEPLLGGVYAGRARRLSAAATVPQLVTMAGRGSLLEQAAAVPASDVPVFAGLEGGMGRLPGVLGAGLEVRRDATVRGLRRDGDGWALTVGSTRSPETVLARRVVLGTPAAPTARLLASAEVGVASDVAAIESASVAVVTLGLPREAVAHLADRSGFLVPPVEARGIKASTFSFAKWDWVGRAGGDVAFLRTSLGRAGEESTLQAADEELVARSLAELAELAGVVAVPLDSHVQRWGGGLPQYAVGHLERIARVRAGLPRGLAVCGAWCDGVGIPAVIASAHRAAADVVRAE
ncbi:protoporphyrinogen oxidase [Nocardioides currus]|uniref:Coproporphyrinogen III oxidase n=1 Tax=Nocardioides currus TaxID=2133958 RepID=A0A2R7Z360_9ACTN|nr:protoporphyrinogen oxidase [Nocardioides currus]